MFTSQTTSGLSGISFPGGPYNNSTHAHVAVTHAHVAVTHAHVAVAHAHVAVTGRKTNLRVRGVIEIQT